VEVNDRFGDRHRTTIPLGRGDRHFFAFKRRRRHQKDRANGWMKEVNLALRDEGNDASTRALGAKKKR